MKHLLPLFFTIVSFSCSKDDNCTKAIITQSAMPCNIWGIKIGDKTYPSGAIPASFQQEGRVVCVNYELYEDMRLCVCCGGTWANIKSIK